MSVPIILQPEAEEQIISAARWWAQHRSAEQAERWYAGILDAIGSLADTASRHPAAHENEQFPCDLRQMNFGIGRRPTHRVLFTIRPDAVVVLSVRHAAQDEVTPDDFDASFDSG